MALNNLFKRGPAKPKDPDAPSLTEVLKKDIKIFVNWIFSTKEAGGRNRRWLLILVGALWWAWMAFRLYPTGEASFFAYPFQALFSARVFRHVLVVLITLWNAINMTAKYIDDVFELGNPEIAFQYVLRASLAGRYETINIKDGKLASNPDSPLVKIGGPGLVKVYMDSAALFEKHDGFPNVVDASDGTVALDRFERLRKTVSTRDHVDETKIVIRTKDGINVFANGVRIKYHIHRGGKDSSMDHPYPTSKQAVQNLVYKENVFKYIEPKAHQPRSVGKGHMGDHYEALGIKSAYFQNKLREIIAGATLNEFVARISQREVEKEDADQSVFTSETQPIVLTPNEAEANGTPAADEADDSSVTQTNRTEAFIPRDEITQNIYAQNDLDDKIKSGLELDWIDIGTWEFPEKAKHIAEQHREAWEISLKNIANKSETRIAKMRKKSNMETMKMILSDVQRRSSSLYVDNEKAIDRLLRNYKSQFSLAVDHYNTRGEEAPDHLINVLRYYDEFLKTQRFHWVNEDES